MAARDRSDGRPAAAGTRREAVPYAYEAMEVFEVCFGLDHPYWADDPDFDLDFHIRHVAVPPPGGRKELDALVARLIGRPLDR